MRDAIGESIRFVLLDYVKWLVLRAATRRARAVMKSATRHCICCEGVREGPDRTQGTQLATEEVSSGRPSARAPADGKAIGRRA